MADTEKSTALNKAYADVILNSAKEAAGRIMLSEKKACGYQHELFSVKEEALQMLTRLKQMFDSKVKESEMVLLNKQKKIDELEAQLGEAEDIVEELRTKLRGLYDELEKVTSSQMQTPDNQNFNEETGEVPISSLFKDKNGHHTVKAVISSRHDKSMKDFIFDETNNISPSSFNGNDSDCTWSLCAVEKNEAVISSPVFAHDKSVGTGDVKGLVFDGTNNISPCSFKKCNHGNEKNEVNGNLYVSEKLDDANGEPFIGEEEECKREENEVEVCAVRSSKRFKSQSPRSFSDSDTCRVSGSSEISLHPSSNNDNVNSGEEYSREINTQLEKDLESRNSGDRTTETAKIGVKAARTDSGFVTETAFSWVDKRCIKYTFKRKRRKESFISQNRDLLADGEKEKENIPFGDPKSGFITEQSLE